MKKINKKEPVFFRQFLSENAPESWEELSFKIGYDVRSFMLTEEQNFQCAYTEIRLEPETSHIDHFKKKSLFPNLTFKWDNLLTSCNYDYYGAKFKDRHIKREQYQNLINPVAEDPQQYFTYSITGEILIDENNEKAKITRELFNLNDRSLVEQRKAVAESIRLMYKQLSVDELIDCIGKFDSFIRALYTDLKNIEDVNEVRSS